MVQDLIEKPECLDVALTLRGVQIGSLGGLELVGELQVVNRRPESFGVSLWSQVLEESHPPPEPWHEPVCLVPGYVLICRGMLILSPSLDSLVPSQLPLRPRKIKFESSEPSTRTCASFVLAASS